VAALAWGRWKTTFACVSSSIATWGTITEIAPTMDTHTTLQIFHADFWVNDAGDNPTPMTTITLAEVEQGVWKVNPAVSYSLAHGNYVALASLCPALRKTAQCEGKYPLTIWPYHAMLGGIGHALVPAVEEACFFHTLARNSQTNFEIKGGNPLTENYSVLRPEVLDGPGGRPSPRKTPGLFKSCWTSTR
jgi:nicotinamidase-related amidase